MQRDVLALWIQEELDKLPVDVRIAKLTYTARKSSAPPNLVIRPQQGQGVAAITVDLDDSPAVTGQQERVIVYRFICGSCAWNWLLLEGTEPESLSFYPHCGTRQSFTPEDVSGRL